jgi:hypothetical protein
MASIAIGLVLCSRVNSIAMATVCGPSASVQGPDDVVTSIRHTLRARGIAIDSLDGCPSVRTTVTRTTSGLRVTVEDPYGRKSERTVAEADAAATIIESWARTEDEAALLAARDWPRAQRTADAAAKNDDGPDALRSTVVPAPAGRALGVSVSAETSLANDGSIWFGAGITACVRLGPACTGIFARAGSDSRLSGSSKQLETSRTAFDLLVAADLPLRWGDVEITPGAGFGLGWMRTSRSGPGGAVEVDSGGLRANAHITFDIPLTRTLFLDLGASVDVLPLAHTATYRDEGLTLAGEPRGFVRATIGLRYSAP